MAIRIDQSEENQFEFVLNLLSQQEEVIVKLDELNEEIEDLIEKLAAERKAELGIAELGIEEGANSELETQSDSGEQRKAA